MRGGRGGGPFRSSRHPSPAPPALRSTRRAATPSLRRSARAASPFSSPLATAASRGPRARPARAASSSPTTPRPAPSSRPSAARRVRRTRGVGLCRCLPWSVPVPRRRFRARDERRLLVGRLLQLLGAPLVAGRGRHDLPQDGAKPPLAKGAAAALVCEGWRLRAAVHPRLRCLSRRCSTRRARASPTSPLSERTLRSVRPGAGSLLASLPPPRSASHRPPLSQSTTGSLSPSTARPAPRRPLPASSRSSTTRASRRARRRSASSTSSSTRTRRSSRT